jgi:hypothetical protein
MLNEVMHWRGLLVYILPSLAVLGFEIPLCQYRTLSTILLIYRGAVSDVWILNQTVEMIGPSYYQAIPNSSLALQTEITFQLVNSSTSNPQQQLTSQPIPLPAHLYTNYNHSLTHPTTPPHSTKTIYNNNLNSYHLQRYSTPKPKTSNRKHKNKGITRPPIQKRPSYAEPPKYKSYFLSANSTIPPLSAILARSCCPCQRVRAPSIVAPSFAATTVV